MWEVRICSAPDVDDTHRAANGILSMLIFSDNTTFIPKNSHVGQSASISRADSSPTKEKPPQSTLR